MLIDKVGNDQNNHQDRYRQPFAGMEDYDAIQGSRYHYCWWSCVCGDDVISIDASSNTAGNFNAMVARLDADGAIVWQQVFNAESTDAYSEFQRIVADASGDLLCMGTIGPSNGYRYLFLVRIDSNGVSRYQKISSNNARRESALTSITVSEIAKIESGIIHLVLTGQKESDARYYYTQIGY
jgi:hypothetical protein